MTMPLQHNVKKVFSVLEILLILGLAMVPLFLTFPYRINIFLSWEGAYRMSIGQVPFKDFGMPMGYMYWVIPAMFFKIFGPNLFTLVIAQTFINIVSGLSFRQILKNFDAAIGVRFISVLLYVISFSFFNFWPWYNHTVIVYEMVGLAFLTYYLLKSPKPIWITLAAVFIFFSFFTKQDGGALAFLVCIALLIYDSIYKKRFEGLIVFMLAFLFTALIFIGPLLQYDFGYWFNHGQPPHTARLSIRDIISDFLMGSQWIKFYILLIALSLMYAWKNKSIKNICNDYKQCLMLLLTIGILVQAAIFQFTSYTPPDNNIFFHSFAVAYLLQQLSQHGIIDFQQKKWIIGLSACILLWWSGVFFKYIERITDRIFPKEKVENSSGENIINRETYILKSEADEADQQDWVFADLPQFSSIYMPESTVKGIKRIEPLLKANSHSMLNMTELTPLAAAYNIKLPRGKDEALWYHLGVSFFNRDAAKLEQKIVNKEYNLILFEEILRLNNFYPFRVRDTLLSHYTKIDSFAAPRRGDTQGKIFVFVKK